MSQLIGAGHHGGFDKIEAVTVCVGYSDFLREAIQQNQGLFDRWIIVTSPDDIETRELWADHKEGYVPIGFFQMWHSDTDQYNGARIKRYPTEHNDACRTDVQFGLQWDRRNRVLLPEVTALHLESEPAPLGANWKGRQTKPWDAE